MVNADGKLKMILERKYFVQKSAYNSPHSWVVKLEDMEPRNIMINVILLS